MKRIVLAAVALLAVTAVPARAATIMYSFSPGSYYNPTGQIPTTPVTGSFDFDTVTNSVSNVVYTSFYGPRSTGSTYPLDSTLKQVVFGDVNSTNYDVFQLSGSLANGGTLTITGGTHPGVVEDAGGSLVSATSAVPEPTTWAMLLLGFGMIGLAMRKRSNVRTTVSYA